MKSTCWDTHATDSIGKSGQKDTEASIPYRPFHRAIDETLKISESSGHRCVLILPEYGYNYMV